MHYNYNSLLFHLNIQMRINNFNNGIYNIDDNKQEREREREGEREGEREREREWVN